MIKIRKHQKLKTAWLWCMFVMCVCVSNLLTAVQHICSRPPVIAVDSEASQNTTQVTKPYLLLTIRAKTVS